MENASHVFKFVTRNKRSNDLQSDRAKYVEKFIVKRSVLSTISLLKVLNELKSQNKGSCVISLKNKYFPIRNKYFIETKQSQVGKILRDQTQQVVGPIFHSFVPKVS